MPELTGGEFLNLISSAIAFAVTIAVVRNDLKWHKETLDDMKAKINGLPCVKPKDCD